MRSLVQPQQQANFFEYGVLQGSLISPLLFDLYINDLIIELNKNAYEILAYADDLAIIVEGRNSLSNIFNILEKWS